MSQNDTLPSDLLELFEKRNALRAEKKYEESDEVRKEIETRGYLIKDTPTGSTIEKIETDAPVEQTKPQGLGKIALFGSGETSPTGRRIHELLIKDFKAPVTIGLVETAAGFEQNPHQWYKRVADMMVAGLEQAKPDIRIISALRNDGDFSTNKPEIVDVVKECLYVHLGAGSPTYAAKHLRDSLLYALIIEHIKKGYPVSLASAASIAFGTYVLPVYEIYKAGFDPYWETGLNMFDEFGLNLTAVPHWNNEEGGADIDTSRCYIGLSRFEKLVKELPGTTNILGIDEQTACVIDLNTKSAEVQGTGSVTYITSTHSAVHVSGDIFSLA